MWGAVGPDTFDCLGFTSYVYRHCAGIEITRTTYTQINVGVPVSYNNMQPGDLVFTYDNEHVEFMWEVECTLMLHIQVQL